MCEFCRTEPHLSGCPNETISEKRMYTCDDCGLGIYADDKYLENNNGLYFHYECVLEWEKSDILEEFDINYSIA